MVRSKSNHACRGCGEVYAGRRWSSDPKQVGYQWHILHSPVHAAWRAEHPYTASHSHYQYRPLGNPRNPRVNRNYQRDQQIADLLRDNPFLTLEQIGQELGMTRERVRQIGKRHGVMRSEQFKGFRRDGTQRGTTICRRCETWFATGDGTAHRLTDEHLEGMRRNPFPTEKRERNERAIELYLAGVKIADIPRLLMEEGWPSQGLFQPMVYRLLARAGIPLNRNGGRYTRQSTYWYHGQQATDMLAEYEAGVPPKDLFQKYLPESSVLSATTRLYSLLKRRNVTFRQNPGMSARLRAWNAQKRLGKGENSQESP